jgi:hypothetical protein
MMDLNAWGQVGGLCAIVGSAAFFLGGKIAGWNVEKLETKIEGLRQQLINAEHARKTEVEVLKQKLNNAEGAHKTDVEGFKHRIANAEVLNTFNETRWEDAHRREEVAEKEMAVVRAKLDQLEAQKIANAPEAVIAQTERDLRRSFNAATIASTGTNAILRSGLQRFDLSGPIKRSDH